ncbi:hypothetical protein IEQ34_012810 [Dendrobium chrysotoxum]|uniref:Beta-glucosidase n=1 Tax=Dendrobium chrysotoxum TaxID=161865 RepID=A0AAV7GMT7_DENCH|nr:hypothetical protein IEQ34_012810 [Dendrobium chrysotoxum]
MKPFVEKLFCVHTGQENRLSGLRIGTERYRASVPLGIELGTFPKLYKTNMEASYRHKLRPHQFASGSLAIRVKHWITMNEPWTFTILGYAEGSFPPRRCSVGAAGECSVGDSGREPYTVAHHIILAHAALVRLYGQNFQVRQYCNMFYEKKIFKSRMITEFNRFMDPLTRGDYPNSMREHAGHRLPKFTEKQTKMIKGSYDFIGLNYYTAIYARNLLNTNGLNRKYREGVPIGPQAASKWLSVYPRGIYYLLLYTKMKYNNPVIYITENDDARIDYYMKHLINVRRANRKGMDVRGFFAWSMFDNFEWTDGYTVRFGI